MAKSDAGTSSSNTRGGVYQVFLNFCGRDTRSVFTEFLHQELENNCIYGFIDDEELRVGEEINGELLRAIDNSQIYIPIFSRNYANSKWCLRELKRMVDNTRLSKEKKILPIFYDVEPYDVDLKTPLYKTAIENHKEEHEKKFPHGGASWEGESWEDALKKVDKIKGWELRNCKGPAELTRLVVTEVLLRLKIKYKTVTPHLAGFDGRVAEILELLDVNISDVRFLILYGIGGIGKTTLAKVIYNELSSHFEKCCSFLDDVREASKKEGLLSLQKKLLTEIVGPKSAEIIYDVDYGKRKIEEALGSAKVFIVLDNVDDEKQIKNLMGQGWLRPGTRIIITTRNKSVVKKQRRAHEMEATNSEQSPEILLYEMKGMNADHALGLFTRYASLKGSLEVDFDELSREIVDTIGGLPLALEVIGSFLNGQDKEKWKETLGKLKLIPHENVQEKLMISYEALKDYEREIFLDVACFLIDEDVTNAIDMWADCEFFPNLAIDVLVHMSLIKIKDDNKFWMHDQLRDLGRDIICRESPKNLGERSRLWTSENLDFVKTDKRKENVKALDLDGGSSYISISSEEIERFESLRFLRLSNGAFLGDFIACPKLRWISWHSPPSYFDADNVTLHLLVLELFDNCFADDSKLWDSLKMATKLKSLALVRCHRLTRTPDLSGCLTLERLTFDDCGSLKEIDGSIEMLRCLLDLNIIRCELVEQVPDEIGGLVELKHFSLNRCRKVRGLPTSIGNLTSLRKLDLSMTGVSSLPSSIGKLSGLLDLNLSLSKILEIPNTIERLVKLRRLDLKATKISRLTDSIGKLKSLCILDLSFPQLDMYPNSWELPKAIEMLDKLEELNLSHHRELVGEIPNEIGHLSSLGVLKLSGTKISRVPGTINMLSRLLTLDLTLCDEITELPELQASLVCLRVESRSLQMVPNLSKLTNLVELVLSDRSFIGHSSNLKHKCDLRWIGRLSKLEKLKLCLLNIAVPPIELGFLFLLEHLTLLSLDLQPLEQLPPSLLSLELDNFSSIGLPQSMEIPSNLTLRFSRLQEIQLHRFSRLQHLRLDDCDLKSLSIPSSVRTLRVGECPKMIEIQFLGLSVSLEELEIYCCGSLGRIVLCGEGGSFGVINQSESSSSESTYHSPRVLLPSACKKLKRLALSLCENLLEIQVIGTLLSLQDISIYGCHAMEKFGVSNLKNLHRLVINMCAKLRVVEGIDEQEFLTELDVAYCNSLETLLDISNSKILDECLIRVTHCGDLVISSAENPKYIPFKRYKEMAQQGAPRSETNKSMEKIEDEIAWQPVDMKTSDRNYAIASVQKLVGIDDRKKQMTDLLEMEASDEVCIIGIYGTDGIGKTTLAKAVYDNISSFFDSCSFLFEVDETAQNPRDMRFLQTKLICDILALDREDPSSHERIEIFVDIFRKMKVLIVVDGVEKQSHLHAIVGDQLHWFGLGSRIIVTSQNEKILEGYDPEKTRTYMVSELDDGQAFELFSKHAFTISSQYDGLADRIVNATEKLPLAVEVVGSFLRGRSIQEWEKMEKSMKQFMMSSQKATVGLQEILNICYKELDQQLKDIFLDVACSISGVDARIASYMWPDCYLPSSGCFLMPLAKFGENNELQMHRLLRCLGKRVFMQEESQDPSSRRFCTQDMVLKAKNREKGIENVGACDSCILTAADFVSMPALNFLKLDDAKVLGNFTGVFPSLRWLRWQRVPQDFEAENFVLTELVIFDLSWSKVTEDWRGWSEIKMEKLKVLNLTGCSDLLITPNFSGCKDLEILILERCAHLVKLDPSIGHLKRLVSLNLNSCSQLNGLPVELGHVTALEELFVDGTSVREIPISIGNLKQLKILSGFKCFPLTHLPSSIRCLTALAVLSLDGTKISKLPSSLGELLNLRRLSLRDCRYMQELPNSISKLGISLEELDISATRISKLPASIKNLQTLRVLRMDSSLIQALPGEIGNLTKLEELHASWCRRLKGAIPRDIKRLHHLRSLTLGHSSISSLPPDISAISSLHTLDLLQCNEIEVLPELPPSLICLRVSSKRMKAIPLLNDLKELEELYLSDEDPEERQSPSKQLMPESKVKQLSIWFSRLRNLELFQSQRIFLISFPKLRKLELSLSRITKLQFVYEPTDIPQLKTLTLSGLSLEEVSELPKTLSVLSIRGCSSLKSLPIVQCLTNISAFELYHSAIEENEGLKALKRLDISNCKIQNLNGIGQLTSLRSLILSDCDDLSLPDLSNLKSLKILEIRRCKRIHQIRGLEKLSLEKLTISECPAENSV